MIRRVFFSFHYELDYWRTQQVRNIKAFEDEKTVGPNKWESIVRGGEAAIKRWIDREMRGKSCVVVLIGEKTAGRPWINYEIEKGWGDGKGVLGIRVHGLKDQNGETSWFGGNDPFEDFSFSDVVRTYDPASWEWDSKTVYANIRDNLADWIEEAIEIRSSG